MLNKDELASSAEKATKRDPRENTFGCYFGGSFVLDGLRLFAWFENQEGLIKFLLEMAPAVYDIDDDQAQAYREQMAPVMESLRKEGFSEELRSAVEDCAGEFMCLDWWGRFADLQAGNPEFARTIRSEFHEFEDDQEGNTTSVGEEQLDKFVAFLREYGI